LEEEELCVADFLLSREEVFQEKRERKIKDKNLFLFKIKSISLQKYYMLRSMKEVSIFNF
jgi:hypothetical protein